MRIAVKKCSTRAQRRRESARCKRSVVRKRGGRTIVECYVGVRRVGRAADISHQPHLLATRADQQDADIIGQRVAKVVQRDGYASDLAAKTGYCYVGRIDGRAADARADAYR